MEDKKLGENEQKESTHFAKGKHKEAAFLTAVAGMSTVFGFGFAITLAKKKDPSYFNKGLVGSKGLPESGGALALRALGWGTFYAVTGVGLICWGTCKILGVKSMEDFRNKVQNIMPVLPKKENPGRSEFSTVRELVNYIIDEDAKERAAKQRLKSEDMK